MPPTKAMSGWRRTTPPAAKPPAPGPAPAWPGSTGFTAGDPVTAEQMKALFGLGLHPLAAQRLAQLEGPDLTDADYQAVTRLGAPFKVFDNDISPFRVEVARRIAAVNQADGLPGDWPVPAAIRARIRTEVATEYFRAEHGRDPDGPRELAGIIAKLSRPRTDAVAGYDLTFSPVKSVSTLWAVADPPIAAAIERAHQAAVADALRFLEAARVVHPDRRERGPAGRCSGVGGGGVHPPGQPGRRPGSAHPCGGGEQGPNPRRPLARPSTAGCCSRPPWPRRRPTTPPWKPTSATPSASGSPNGRTRIRGNGRCGRSSASTPH